MSGEFNPGNNLNDIRQLADECMSMHGGMIQQAIASRTGSALGGHPNPEFLFGRVATVLEAAANALRALAPPPPPPEPTDETPVTMPNTTGYTPPSAQSGPVPPLNPNKNRR